MKGEKRASPYPEFTDCCGVMIHYSDLDLSEVMLAVVNPVEVVHTRIRKQLVFLISTNRVLR